VTRVRTAKSSPADTEVPFLRFASSFPLSPWVGRQKVGARSIVDFRFLDFVKALDEIFDDS
jgi:hypothetical protein